MTLDGRQTIVLAILVLYFGKLINGKIKLLRNYNIPEPVTGGLLASGVFGILYGLFSLKFNFALDVRDELLIVFFTTIGLSSRFATLLKGGAQLGILLVMAVVYLMIQNGTGVAVASLAGFDPLVGIVGGSVSLSGGHGTAIAWAPIFAEEHGISRAGEIGIAAATFGLILGGVLGGPLARYLVEKNQLTPSTAETELAVGIEHKAEEVPIEYESMLRVIFAICIAVGLGIHLDQALKQAGMQLPTFVSCLFAGILVTNLAPPLVPYLNVPRPEQSRSLALVSEVCLGLFLAMSLMSLELWTLGSLGIGLLLILIAQVVVVLIWAGFLVFRAMGKTYDAAVMAAGYVGLALGATPTAIANMTAVTKLYGPAPRAFIIVPLIGAFFIDLANAVVIQLYIGWFVG
ncbi:MAG: sodium/glutamate symporter [Pseudomonadota bacterium]